MIGVSKQNTDSVVTKTRLAVSTIVNNNIESRSLLKYASLKLLNAALQLSLRVVKCIIEIANAPFINPTTLSMSNEFTFFLFITHFQLPPNRTAILLKGGGEQISTCSLKNYARIFLVTI